MVCIISIITQQLFYPMEYVNISTTQNIDLEYRIAGIGDRILAFAFDTLVLGSWSLIWALIFTSSGGGLLLWHGIFYIPVVFYNLLCEIFLNGQSFGKMVLKIRVAKLDGSELTLGSCILRWVFRLIDISLFSGAVAIISILVSDKSQRLGDMAARTTVVKLAKNNLLNSTTYMEIPEDYMPVYQQAELLNDDDASTIKEVLTFVEKGNNTGTEINYHSMHVKLQNALKQKLNITEINGSAKQFLIDLLKDYNYFHQ